MNVEIHAITKCGEHRNQMFTGSCDAEKIAKALVGIVVFKQNVGGGINDDRSHKIDQEYTQEYEMNQ